MIDRAPPARGTSLRQVLPDAVFTSGDVEVRSCCTDSRQCRPGDLFVTLLGGASDGGECVAEAIEHGATAVLSDRPLPGCTVPLCVVDDVRDAYGRLCQALAGYPARSLKIVGITGASGKTTTSYLSAAVLAAGGWRSGVLGTLGYFDGNEWQNACWTTPPPPVLAQWLARIAAAGCTHAAVEVSGHALAQKRVAGLDFDVACVTNDHHGFKGHRKAQLFDHLLPEGFAVVNVDDPLAENFLSRLDGPVLTVGMRGAAEVTALPLEQFPSEQTFLLSVGDESIPVRSPLIGHQNIYNCLVAAAVGLAYSIDLPTIVQGLEVVQRVPGRLERIECGQPFSVFVDDARTPGALSRCLKTLRAVTSGRLICVFDAGGDRDKPSGGQMYRAVESAADLAVQVVDDRREAIASALGHAQPGDCVLIAGKSHETTQAPGDKHYEFGDRQVARQCLYESLAAERLYRASA
ncbi:MAG TPA: UDP-N-acetylmuramoyl-L-alanyl-D-glutamate--2,6-diaminopimelate ligase [Pirellulales bacterium]|nr:UDP-N-acetylmuramoyl-L-alanyl-D-glutamate--2,6-diaminopimelate ligase [Pirellulales bacterium]